ncbi:hypothetical protein [Jiangella gansuensis]|uniref:hypothetical protein n=1 Tax=Jiangella gansuensis TaxID=281473 RepID=UPI0004BB4F40|nr:hypothetical protein [Jiangella gansuensis]
MSEPRETATAAITEEAREELAAPNGRIVLSTVGGAADVGAGACTDGFCAL